MHTSLRILPAILLAAVIIACSSGNIVSVKPEVLKKYRRAAVAPMEITVDSRDTQGRAFVTILTGLLSEKVNNPGITSLLGSLNVQDAKKMDQFQDAVSEAVNRNLLARGFTPIERARIKTILKELGFQKTGLVDPARASEMGRLAGAESLFMGTITIQVERDIFNTTATLHLSGRIVSVAEGIILVSGTSTLQTKEPVTDDIIRLVDRWFTRVKKLD